MVRKVREEEDGEEGGVKDEAAGPAVVEDAAAVGVDGEKADKVEEVGAGMTEVGKEVSDEEVRVANVQDQSALNSTQSYPVGQWGWYGTVSR